MKLQKYIKNKKQKQIVIASIIGIVFLIGGIVLYNTFALYKEEQSFNVLQGIVPDFNRGDLKLAITVNGEKKDVIPDKGNYKVEVNCDQDAKGNWNYSKWQVEVSSFRSGTKCDVIFTTTTESIPSIGSTGTIYFSQNGDFTEIIESLGKQPSDFTASNFRALINSFSSNMGRTIASNGQPASRSNSITYSNGKVSISGSISLGAYVGDSSQEWGYSSSSISVSGYAFDPSSTPFAN